MTRLRNLLLATVAALTAVLGAVAPPASAAVTSKLVNFNASGQQVVRFDTQGNAVDAHDGQIAQFGNRYYLYGIFRTNFLSVLSIF